LHADAQLHLLLLLLQLLLLLLLLLSPLSNSPRSLALHPTEPLEALAAATATRYLVASPLFLETQPFLPAPLLLLLLLLLPPLPLLLHRNGTHQEALSAGPQGVHCWLAPSPSQLPHAHCCCCCRLLLLLWQLLLHLVGLLGQERGGCLQG
jgi:hypothetical protein